MIIWRNMNQIYLSNCFCNGDGDHTSPLLYVTKLWIIYLRWKKKSTLYLILFVIKRVRAPINESFDLWCHLGSNIMYFSDFRFKIFILVIRVAKLLNEGYIFVIERMNQQIIKEHSNVDAADSEGIPAYFRETSPVLQSHNHIVPFIILPLDQHLWNLEVFR